MQILLKFFAYPLPPSRQLSLRRPILSSWYWSSMFHSVPRALFPFLSANLTYWLSHPTSVSRLPWPSYLPWPMMCSTPSFDFARILTIISGDNLCSIIYVSKISFLWFIYIINIVHSSFILDYIMLKIFRKVDHFTSVLYHVSK